MKQLQKFLAAAGVSPYDYHLNGLIFQNRIQIFGFIDAPEMPGEQDRVEEMRVFHCGCRFVGFSLRVHHVGIDEISFPLADRIGSV